MNTDLFLNTLCDNLPYDEALSLREERASILEYCANLNRYEAEKQTGLLILTHKSA